MAKVNWGKVGFWGGLFGLFAYLASNDDKETVPAPATGLGGTDTEDGIEFTRIDNDRNGNPRYVVHFLNLLKDGEKDYEVALKRAKKIGGKKYHNKKYGGGIVFQSYNNRILAEKIKELVSGNLKGPTRTQYPNMDRERREFHKWATQKLQPGYKEEETDLADYLKNYKDKLIERVGWVFTGNYGGEIYHILLNRYIDITEQKKGKQIPKALRALAIETFYWYCFKEYPSLNAAKVRSIVKKTWSKSEMEDFNKAIVDDEIMPHINDID